MCTCTPDRASPLQDALTAIRCSSSVAEAGLALFKTMPSDTFAAVCGWLSATQLICWKPLKSLRSSATFHSANCATNTLKKWCQKGNRLRRIWLSKPGRAASSVTLKGSQKVRTKITEELQLISELHYEKYFLTVFDIVRFARSQHILCQGRGSAANSAVCYCLGITEVDPAQSALLFRALHFQRAQRAT